MSNIDQTLLLRQLEERVRKLEQHPGPDSLAPNPFSFNSKGELEEKLTGKLEAQGIILPAFNLPKPPGEIIWVENGQTYGRILGLTEQLNLELVTDNGSDTAEAFLQLRAQPAASDPPAAADIIASAFEEDNTGRHGASRTIIDSLGQSSFLQLPPLQKDRLVLSEGFTNIVWPGGSAESNETTISGLPSSASLALYYLTPIWQDTVFFCGVRNPEPDSFGIQAWSVSGAPPAGHEQLVYWLALNT